MATCPSCRSEIEIGDRFCSNCGASLVARCPACGDDLRPGAEACSSCGTPIRSTIAHEHRLVTAIYVDLVGSTGLAEELDAENLSRIVRTLHDAVQEEVEERDGVVGAFVGDGVLGVFGLPAAHDDDPDRAIAAGRAIMQRLEAVDEALGRRLGVGIQARMGINTGELLAPVGTGTDVGTLAGDVLNVAARLQEAADPGAIVVAERTARSARSFRFDDLGLIDVRGRARPIHAYSVAGASEVTSLAITAPLFGRTAQREALRSLYHRVVAEGRPHLAVVTGPAGVGKSRLVREFLDWASLTDPSVTTLAGRCLPYGEDITYRPLAEVVADLTGVTTTTDPTLAAAHVTELLTPHLGSDEIAVATDAMLRMIGLDPPGDTPTPAPGRVRELLRSTWRSLLSGIASDGPLLLLVEDIHWAGDALLDLIEHVVRRGAGPILVVSPARPELVDRGWSTPPTTTTIHVDPLEPQHATALATRLLATAGLPVADVDRITERADGNPFFIEELVREGALRRSDRAHPEPDDLPATIHGVVAARIDLLQGRERRVLQAASVIGRIFWPSAVGYVTGLDDDSLAASLAHLESLQLIRVNLGSGDEPEYIFQHVLIREAAYGRLSRPDLARYHGGVATWLEARAGDRPESAERLAYHTFRAYQAAIGTSDFPPIEEEGLRALAVDRLVESARRARSRAAFGRAREIAEAADAIALGPLEQARVQEQLGLTLLAEYDGDDAWIALRTAVDLHLEADEPDSAEIARLCAAAIETPLRWQGTMRQLPPMAEILRYLQIGLDHAGSDDSESLARLLTALSFAPIATGRHGADARSIITVDEARHAGRRARQMAHRLGLPHAESAALDALNSHALWGGRIQEAAAISAERLEIVDAVSDPWEVGDTHAMAASLSFDLGHYETARDLALGGYERTIDEAPSVALHALTWASLARVQTGDWNAVTSALSKAYELLDVGRHAHPPLYATPLYAAAAFVAECRGRSEEANRLMAILTDVWNQSDIGSRDGHPHARWSRQLGPIYIRRGDFETAWRLVESDDAERIGRESDRHAVMCDLVAATSAWDDADEVIEETRRTASAYGLESLHAHADRLEGLASIAMGDVRGGIALLDAATTRFTELGDHWEAHRTLLAVGETGRPVDVGEITAFFEGLRSIDEVARATALADPGVARP
jgi:class 3 adenylate cyclase